MDRYITELKKKFPNWDPTTDITKENFTKLGYSCILWPKSGHDLTDLKRYISAVSWCKELFPDTSHCAANMFFFADSNEATQFVLTWI